MAITTQLNEKANVKLGTAADALIAGRRVISLQETQISTLNQSTIIISTFAVDVANSKNLLVIVDGKVLTEGVSSDYTLTNISSNNTSNTISLNQLLAADLNIKLLYLGVVVANPSMDTLSPAMSDWQPETGITFTNFGTVTNVSIKSRRIGDVKQFKGNLTLGTLPAAIPTLNLPSGTIIDVNKLPSSTSGVALGTATQIQTGTRNLYANVGSGDDTVTVMGYNGIDADKIYFAFRTISSAYAFAETAPSLYTSGDVLDFEFSIPVAGLSSNVIAQNSKVYNAAAYAANGTNVTSTPASLGQFRTYKKDASALTGTDDAASGSYLPTSADGFRIDGSIDYGTAGTSGQPNRIEAFVGLNKHVTVQAYSNAGRTGAVNLDVDPDTTFTYYGVSFGYDPTTGVAFADAIDQPTGTTTRFAGRTIPTGGAAPADAGSIYFDWIVSDNVLPVQYSDPSKLAENEILLSTPNGYGAVNTNVRLFSVIEKSIGTAATVINDSNLGTYITINENGVYAISYNSDYYSGGLLQYFITKNASPLNSAPNDFDSFVLGLGYPAAVNSLSSGPTVVVNLKIGDIIRPMTDIPAGSPSTTAGTRFRITKTANG